MDSCKHTPSLFYFQYGFFSIIIIIGVHPLRNIGTFTVKSLINYIITESRQNFSIFIEKKSFDSIR